MMCSIFSAMDQSPDAGLNLHCASDNPANAPIARLRVCSRCRLAWSISDEVNDCGLAIAAAVEVAGLHEFAPFCSLDDVQMCSILTTFDLAGIDRWQENSMIGRTSMDPKRAQGIFAAIASAASMSFASTR